MHLRAPSEEYSTDWQMWDLIVSVPDHCLSFYFTAVIDHDPRLNLSSPTHETGMNNYKIRTPEKFAVIILKFEQCGFTIQ